jgi:hypothetical protein
MPLPPPSRPLSAKSNFRANEYLRQCTLSTYLQRAKATMIKNEFLKEAERREGKNMKK